MKPFNCWSTAYEFIAKGEVAKAVALCEKAPCSTSVECQRFLGWQYYEKDAMDRALSWFFKAAEQGDAEAHYGIGSVHFVRRDFLAALQSYERAADQGCPKAYGWIGYIYQLGLGVPRSVEMAIENYKKSAAHGYILADRALIHLTFQQGNFFNKVFVLPKFFYILIKAAIIAYRNINDERLAGIPNAFEKKK